MSQLARFTSGIAALMLLAASSAVGQTIPAGALLKHQPSGTTNYVFNSSVMLTPPAAPADASATIQAAINTMASASLSKGGVILLAPGTYYLAHTLQLEGSGVTLVGVRAVTSTGQNGSYPTLTYDDSLIDDDYNNRSAIETTLGVDVPIIDTPAAIRFNGNADYSGTRTFNYGGLIGINLTFTGTAGSGSEGDTATGLAMNLPHQTLVRDLTITNAYNGLDVGDSTSPYFLNINISGVRGTFGARLGTFNTDAIKMHALTVTASTGNTSTTLAIIPANMELIGGNLSGGGVGLHITGADSTTFANDVYLRSLLIQHTNAQGMLVDFARQVYVSDTTINYAGAEAIKVTPNFYGGLALTNLRTSYTGLSAIRVQRGMNINLVNAVLLNSGQRKSSASSDDLPIADLSVDSSVTSLNVVGGRFGSANGTTVHEDWGMYVSTTSPLYTPWHTPTLIASNIDFLNIPTAQRSSGITITNPSGYYTLYNAGYFNPPAEDGWSLQNLPTDPVGTGVMAVVKGFNLYDLPEIRDRQWIDLTSSSLSTHPVVDSSGNINAANFTYWEDIAANQFPEGAVLYLPAGHFNSSFSSYTRKIYNLSNPLVINHAAIQVLGDGRNITQITDAVAVPTQNVFQVISGSTGSGLFGLTVFYSKTAALTAPSNTPVTYAPPFLLTNTSQIRLANVGARYSMGGGVSIVDTTNSELFDVDMSSMGVNNTQPTVPLGVYTLTATTNEATADIRFYQAYGEFLRNIWMPSSSSFCNTSTACTLPPDQIPDLEWIRLVGGVTRFRTDSGTLIEGRVGYQTVANDQGTPHNLSSFKFAIDHAYVYGADLQQATDADFDEPWINTRNIAFFAESGVSGNLRILTSGSRGAAFEAFLLQGGATVSLINCQIGNNSNRWTPYSTMQTRPLSGVYVGPSVGSTVFVGGMNGWIANSSYANASVNGNLQDYGIILGTGASTSAYTVYGTDLYGNNAAKVGQQTGGGTGATVLIPN
ncbi:hypothetical protein AB4Y89_22165 [Terriglobus sp. 2YAB30_2]|uniref:hypothetical protein n=1 Tax=Terriglobus sp. 2YAB30_2 TaxID=3233023 RepID=UPI003F95F79A